MKRSDEAIVVICDLGELVTSSELTTASGNGGV
jgi:hypothetical protein